MVINCNNSKYFDINSKLKYNYSYTLVMQSSIRINDNNIN